MAMVRSTRPRTKEREDGTLGETADAHAQEGRDGRAHPLVSAGAGALPRLPRGAQPLAQAVHALPRDFDRFLRESRHRPTAATLKTEVFQAFVQYLKAPTIRPASRVMQQGAPLASALLGTLAGLVCPGPARYTA